MIEDKILIDRELYDEQLRAFERIEAVERLLKVNPAASVAEILAVLGIVGN